jgi:hypothetical protein
LFADAQAIIEEKCAVKEGRQTLPVQCHLG